MNQERISKRVRRLDFWLDAHYLEGYPPGYSPRNVTKAAVLVAAEALAERGVIWATARELADRAGLEPLWARRSLAVLLRRWGYSWPTEWRLFHRQLEHPEMGALPPDVIWQEPGDGVYRYRLGERGKRWLRNRLPRLESRLGLPPGAFRKFVAE